MKNTTTQEELVMRTMIAELKLMNIQLDMLEREIDETLVEYKDELQAKKHYFDDYPSLL